MPSTASRPPFTELLWATLEALRAIGGSGTVQEIAERAIQVGGFTDEQQAVLHVNGSLTELEYRLAWARTQLKIFGALENSSRGVWALTEKGRSMTQADVMTVQAQVRAVRAERRRRPAVSEEETGEEVGEAAERDWKEQLLEVILKMPPDRFEHLAQRLLREAGFISVTVTGQSGDEGIDGVGVYRLSLVSFPIFFQCKRYRGSVPPRAVRDFRGAMQGRGDKGLLITTGTFTADAKQEATREGAPPIDLIDGNTLCDLLKQYSLGVTTTPHTVEDIEIIPGFFADI
jgi:restriction system protein